MTGWISTPSAPRVTMPFSLSCWITGFSYGLPGSPGSLAKPTPFVGCRFADHEPRIGDWRIKLNDSLWSSKSTSSRSAKGRVGPRPKRCGACKESYPARQASAFFVLLKFVTNGAEADVSRKDRHASLSLPYSLDGSKK